MERCCDEDISNMVLMAHSAAPCSGDTIHVHSTLAAEEPAEETILVGTCPAPISTLRVALDALACFLVLYVQMALLPFLLALCSFLLLLLFLILLDLFLLALAYSFLGKRRRYSDQERNDKKKDAQDVLHDPQGNTDNADGLGFHIPNFTLQR